MGRTMETLYSFLATSASSTKIISPRKTFGARRLPMNFGLPPLPPITGCHLPVISSPDTPGPVSEEDVRGPFIWRRNRDQPNGASKLLTANPLFSIIQPAIGIERFRHRHRSRYGVAVRLPGKLVRHAALRHSVTRFPGAGCDRHDSRGNACNFRSPSLASDAIARPPWRGSFASGIYYGWVQTRTRIGRSFIYASRTNYSEYYIN